MSASQQPPASEKFVLSPDQERFIQLRQYMQNVSSTTVEWYKQAFKAFKGRTTAQEYQSRIVASMRARGIASLHLLRGGRILNKSSVLFEGRSLSGRQLLLCQPLAGSL